MCDLRVHGSMGSRISQLQTNNSLLSLQNADCQATQGTLNCILHQVLSPPTKHSQKRICAYNLKACIFIHTYRTIIVNFYMQADVLQLSVACNKLYASLHHGSSKLLPADISSGLYRQDIHIETSLF